MTAQAARSRQAGAWQGRPSGVPDAVPPPSVPLSFLAAAALGLVACGAVWIWARDAAAVDPTSDLVVAAAHLGMLATLSMGLLGALHQFVPVITQRPLASIPAARVTFLAWLAASWLLPFGIASEHEGIVEAGGALAALSVVLLVANLWSPLSVRGKGVPVTGLRFALAGLVVTACFGVAYVADRRGSWFVLSGHVVLAHASIGLFAWLGLAYVAVAEKLWPIFFLAHVPGRPRAGRIAVWGVPCGVVLLAPGLLVGLPILAGTGATVLVIGLGGHLRSLLAHVQHRRRGADLHLVFVATSAGWLIIGAVLALAGTLAMAHHHHSGAGLVAAAIVAFGGWLLETLVGHAHKVVPFVAWSTLRARGIDKNRAGTPLLFADLYDHTWAGVTYGLVTAGVTALCVGLAATFPVATALGGSLLAATGLVSAANLSLGPLSMLRRAASAGPAERRGDKEHDRGGGDGLR